MSRTAEYRRFKGVGKIILIEHDGSLWWTDAYCAARLKERKQEPIFDLFEWWNLRVEPGFYEVNGRVRRDPQRSDPLPNLGSLVPSSLKGLTKLEQDHVGEHPLLVRISRDRLVTSWRLGKDQHVYLSDEFLRHLLTRYPFPSFYGSDPLRPVYLVANDRVVGDDRIVAMQMPVRLS